jgi:hypothetical protein
VLKKICKLDFLKERTKGHKGQKGPKGKKDIKDAEFNVLYVP